MTELAINLSTKCIAESPSTLLSYCYSIIRASIEKGSPQKALLDYKTLLVSLSIHPDRRMFSYVLEACKITSHLKIASETHAKVMKSGLQLDRHLSSSLVTVYVAGDFLNEARQLFEETPDLGSVPLYGNLLIMGYLRTGDYESSLHIFKRMPHRDKVSWNSIIAGSVKSRRFREAISLFRRMLKSGTRPNGFTYSSILSACARIGGLSCGEWVHNMMVEEGINLNFILASALIDMYSKCGRIKTAVEIFNVVKREDVSVWNSMITGFAIHGFGFDALKIFSQMKQENVTPDSITFVGILVACSHCGMVEEGRQFFYTMKHCHKIEPLLEHYGVMVDLLSRAGFLEEAYRMIKEMPMDPDIVIWRALLSACRTYEDSRLGEIVIDHMVELNSGDYVLLSNIYSSTRKWSCAERIRVLMRKSRVRKSSGLSWVEINGILHQFKAGDQSHPQSEAIYRVLDGLVKRIKVEGFVSSTELVLMDVSEEEKEVNLNYHSEKLALSFMVLKTGPGTEIRISKNLRICHDCHNFMKIVSRVLCRPIIVRDRLRFHHFEGGSCSCKDYW
ncbi:pentatricopeptide repeat-containing protein At5g50990 [Aristolochia californica]|uniref:pentatricopeptide repeat-containing protein At5g50990 n=1 Tax=Aristolochia californica TaxID=171875 RepID=UPI0035DEF993